MKRERIINNRKIVILLCSTILYVVVLSLDYHFGISTILDEIDFITAIPVDVIIYIMLPLITLVLTLYYSKSEWARKAYGHKAYSKMLSNKIICFSHKNIYLYFVVFILLSVATIIINQIMIKIFFIVATLLVLLFVSSSLLRLNDDILSIYLDEVMNSIVIALSNSEKIVQLDVIEELAENCSISGEVEAINQIYDMYNHVLEEVFRKYAYNLNDNDGILEGIESIYDSMIYITSLVRTNKNVYTHVRKEYFFRKFILTIYRNDCITLYEKLIKMTISKYFFTTSYKSEGVDRSFGAFVIMASSEAIIEKSDTQLWLNESIRAIKRLISAGYGNLTSNFKDDAVLVSLQDIMLSEKIRSQYLEIDIQELHSLYFIYFSQHIENPMLKEMYLTLTTQVLARLKAESNEEITLQFVEELRKYTMNGMFKENFIHRDNLILMRYIHTNLSDVVGKDFVRTWLEELIVDRRQLLKKSSMSFIYFDYLLEINEQRGLNDEYHDFISNLLVKTSKENVDLSAYVFSNYIDGFIRNIEDSNLFKNYINIIGMFLDNSMKEMEDKYFYSCVHTLFSEYKKYVNENITTSHDHKEIFNLLGHLMRVAIDINSNERYIFVIKTSKELIKEVAKFKNKKNVYYIYELLKNNAKYSLERHFIDIVKTSSNELSWYIKDYFYSEYKEYFDEGMKFIHELFYISVQMDKSNIIIPSFIGTSFIMMGSLGFDKKDSPPKNATIISQLIKSRGDKEKISEIISVSYNLRRAEGSRGGGEFSGVAIDNFYRYYVRH